MSAGVPVDLPARLAQDGVRIAVGPFSVCISSDIGGVAEHLVLLYPDASFEFGRGAHFDLTITGAGGVRRWWRQQAHLVVNGTRPFLPVPAELAGGVFEWGVNFCIGNFASRFVAVHAAVVERHGRALVLCAPSGSGKSTLCAALVLAGWRLFSDEFALIEVSSGAIVPAPRPLSLKEASIDIIRRRDPTAVFSRGGVDVEGQRFVHMRPPAESVRRARETASPGLIVMPRYTPEVATSIEPMTKARTLINLTGQSFNYTLLGAEGFQCLARLAEASDGFKLEYSDLDEVITRLDGMATWA